MVRMLARVAFTLAVLLPCGSLWSHRAHAQEPGDYSYSSWYLGLTYRPAYTWQPARVAARFDYNPYFPAFQVYSPARKPFAEMEGIRPLRSSRYAFNPAASPLEELVDEYRYYGFDYLAEDLAYR